MATSRRPNRSADQELARAAEGADPVGCELRHLPLRIGVVARDKHVQRLAAYVAAPADELVPRFAVQ
jgi:hypothetical protein